MTAYRRVDDLQSSAGWLPVHRDQLRAQRSVLSMGSLYLLPLPRSVGQRLPEDGHLLRIILQWCTVKESNILLKLVNIGGSFTYDDGEARVVRTCSTNVSTAVRRLKLSHCYLLAGPAHVVQWSNHLGAMCSRAWLSQWPRIDSSLGRGASAYLKRIITNNS